MPLPYVPTKISMTRSKGLTDFSEKYQTSWDEKNPLFRRAERTGVAK
jgi:hypothetical protein